MMNRMNHNYIHISIYTAQTLPIILSYNLSQTAIINQAAIFQKQPAIYSSSSLSQPFLIPLHLNFAYKLYLNSMSYQKKSVILQELEQAIRKKALEKSRNKEQVGRNLQSSVEKKKQGFKTALTKEHRIGSINKNQNHERSDKIVEKHISLFNNEQLNPTESNEFKLKKHNNRKFDKLVSLIQYMISSSQKAIKYISSTNFQAEFALKLYKSDKQNLLNEVKNFNVQQFIESCRNSQQTNKNDPSYQLILEENNKLKKQLLIMEKEAEQYHKNGEKELNIKAFERQNHKLKESVRKLIPFQNYKQLIEMIEKENKFEAMAVKCQENRKIAQIEIVVTSLAAERNEILESLAKGRGDKTDRAQKIGQIQGQKEQLQKEINVLKSKINELKESSKLIAEHQILKKNTELLNEKLISLLNQITGGSAPSKRNSQILIEAIKSKVVDLIDRQEQLQKQNSRLKARMQELKVEHQELLLFKEEKQEQAMAFERRMEAMIGEIQNLKENVDLLNGERDEAQDKLNDAERLLRNKEEEIQILKEQLIGYQQKDIEKQELKAKVNQLKKENLSLSKKIEDKDKYYKDKLEKIEEKKMQLEEELDKMVSNLEAHQKEFVNLTKAHQSKADEAELALERMKIEHCNKEEQLNARIAELQQTVSQQRVKYDKLMSTYEQSNDYYKALTDSYNQKHERVNELETCLMQMEERVELLLEEKEKIRISQRENKNDERISELTEQLGRFQSQCERLKKENQALNDKVRTLQQEMIKNCYSSEELQTVRDHNRSMRSTIAQLESTIAQIQEEAKHSQQKLRQKQTKADRLQAQLQQLRRDNQRSKDGHESLQSKFQEQSERYITQVNSLSSSLQNVQTKNSALICQKAQVQKKLTLQTEKSQALCSKISLLESQLQELTQEMRSFTKISNGIASEKEQAKQQILSLEQEVKTLRMELQSTKHQISDQAEINHYKNKQYTYLVKQILKGISIQTQSFEHIEGFQELLEFGSQQVLAMRKRLREEQSNRRRNNRKQGYSSNSEADSPCLQEVKTQLFTAGQEYNALVETQKDEEQDRQQEDNRQEQLGEDKDGRVEINEFEEIRDGETDSVVSEDNRCNLDEFNDLKSQRMNESMLSQTEEQNIGAVSANRNQGTQSEEQQGNNLSDFKDIDSKVNESLISLQNDATPIGPSSPIEKQVQNEQVINYKPKIIEDVSEMSSQKQAHSKPLSNSSKDFNISNISPRQQFHYHSKANQSSGGSLFSPRSKEVKNNANRDKLDDFEQVRSENQSFTSSKDIKAKASLGSGEINYRSDVMIYPITKVLSSAESRQENSQEIKQELPQENASGADFQQFDNFEASKMNESMLSEKEHNFSQFNELPQRELNESVLSKKEENQQLGIDNFAEVAQEEVNRSVLSEKQHGMSQFGDLEQEPNNYSMLSHQEKKTSEHGLSEFGQFQEQKVNDSILSEKMSREDEGSRQERQEKGNSLDEFDEFKPDTMNQSIVSDRGSKQ